MENIRLRVNASKTDFKITGISPQAHFTHLESISPVLLTAGNVRMATIIAAVCRVFDVPEQHLVGPRRARQYARPRQMAMYIAKRRCGHLSLPAIAHLLGKKDHTTVMYGIKRAQELIETNPDFRADYYRVLDEIERTRVGHALKA